MKQEEWPAQAQKTPSSSTAFKERLLKATFGGTVVPQNDYDFYKFNNECKEHNSLTFLEAEDGIIGDQNRGWKDGMRRG